MKRISLILALLGVLLVFAGSRAPQEAAPPTCVITAYGAEAGDEALDTEAIREAIADCHASGGGTVVVPPGTYRAGAFRLESYIELHLAPGARHVAITGTGTIDGSGTSFMDEDVLHIGGGFERAATRQGQDYLSPDQPVRDGPIKPLERPGNLITFAGSRHLLIRGVTLLDSPFWTIHINGSEKARVTGVTILNNLLVPNGDGIHCTVCQDLHVSDCTIEAGDDAIAITGIGNERHENIIPGFEAYQGTTRNVTISDCKLKSRSSAIRVGYGNNPVENVVVQNVIIEESNRGLGVFTRGAGSVRNVLFENVVIETRLHTGGWWGQAEPIHVSAVPSPVDEEVGRIENVRFSNIIVRSDHGILVYGSEESVIQDLTFDGVHLFPGQSHLNLL